MTAAYPFQNSPRCTATPKRTGKPCQAPAVNGWSVCRFHGAGGGAPKGERNGAYRHGRYTQETVQACQMLRLYARVVKDTLDQVE
jgi:hypothetical protein